MKETADQYGEAEDLIDQIASYSRPVQRAGSVIVRLARRLRVA